MSDMEQAWERFSTPHLQDFRGSIPAKDAFRAGWDAARAEPSGTQDTLQQACACCSDGCQAGCGCNEAYQAKCPHREVVTVDGERECYACGAAIDALLNRKGTS